MMVYLVWYGNMIVILLTMKNFKYVILFVRLRDIVCRVTSGREALDTLELAFEKSAIPNKKGFQLKAENPCY